MKKNSLKNLIAIILFLFWGTSSMYAQQGEAISMDGIKDSIMVPYSAAFNTLPITIEAWVNTSFIGSNEEGIVSHYAPASGNGWRLYINSGQVVGWYFNTPSNLISYLVTPGVVNDGNWHHIAFVVNNTDAKLYVDGSLAVTVLWTGTAAPPTSTQNIVMGSYSGNPAHYHGKIDEVRIWNIERTNQEISNTINCEITSFVPGLIANYHFDNGIAGGNNAGIVAVTDASGNGHNGTLYNSDLTGTTSNWVAPGGVNSSNHCSLAGINELDLNTYSIFPNPAQQTFFIHLKNNTASPATIELVDILGKVVYSEKFNATEMQIPVEHIDNGLYSLKIISAENMMTQKLLVAH